MRPQDRLVSRLRDIVLYATRAKATVGERRFDEMNSLELDALCYVVLIVSEATMQALALDNGMVNRYPEIPWQAIRGTGNRLRHGYASIDLQIVHEVVDKGYIDQSLDFAQRKLNRYGI